ncbi:MAG: bifunctional oligoribonuclease/PAP phosphatase NrnA [Campylobacterales bacterium]|nr:bifunctional oligoribonuclease/PAP phosphatase NrnA [Campylobacterales bacterium]
MYHEVWQQILSSNKIVILSHINPDSDAIGSSLALYNALKGFKNVTVVNFTKELPLNVDFLDGFDKIKHEMPKSYDLVISVDCGNYNRLGFEVTSKIINLDHHEVHEDYGTYNIIDGNLASSSLVVYKLLKANSIKISKSVATCIYTALVADCGFFKYESVNAEVFEISAELLKAGVNANFVANMLTQRVSLAKFRLTQFVLETMELYIAGKVAIIYATLEMFRKSGAKRVDCEGISSIPRTLATVELSIFLIEELNGDIKVSFRSKTNLDVSKIADEFGGGGHIHSSGAVFKSSSVESVKSILINYLKKVIHE